jgi:hypothetical protein
MMMDGHSFVLLKRQTNCSDLSRIVVLPQRPQGGHLFGQTSLHPYLIAHYNRLTLFLAIAFLALKLADTTLFLL